MDAGESLSSFFSLLGFSTLIFAQIVVCCRFGVCVGAAWYPISDWLPMRATAVHFIHVHWSLPSSSLSTTPLVLLLACSRYSSCSSAKLVYSHLPGHSSQTCNRLVASSLFYFSFASTLLSPHLPQ
ncbi:hypothetical protein CRM22_003636 [Opisthorchis felineus]|uniref:Uncharacterized protein n=1 Tax=Opisthorchis felineus TaxID=147828 RepID=A0A4V3SFS8_OPIFE|nr:hypothetical protein CRM22_003636 [Opisthorchis felineus]